MLKRGLRSVLEAYVALVTLLAVTQALRAFLDVYESRRLGPCPRGWPCETWELGGKSLHGCVGVGFLLDLRAPNR
jgi:hypothetical protein